MTDIELAEGDSRLELRRGYSAEAGVSSLPFPSTLLPPSFLEDIIPAFEIHEPPVVTTRLRLGVTGRAAKRWD